MQYTTTIMPSRAEHLADLDRRMCGRAWRHVETAAERPSTSRRTEPPCIEPLDRSTYAPAVRHTEHAWIDVTACDGAYADVAPGSQYHERCALCGIYRTRHSNQGQPDGGIASYFAYHPWGTAPPAGQLTDR